MELTKIQNIIDTLKKENKPFWVFAIFRMDELVDKWSVIASAPWVTEENRSDMFSHIIDLFIANFEREELLSIARVALMPKTEHLISLILEDGTKGKIIDKKINGNMVHEGYILECNPDLVWVDQPQLLDLSVRASDSEIAA